MNSENRPANNNGQQRNQRPGKSGKKRFSLNKNSGQSLRPAGQEGQNGNKPNGQRPKQERSNDGKKSNFFRHRPRPNNSSSAPANPGNQPSSIENSLSRKYEHFMEMYLNTRRKFFSHFFSDDRKQREKSEKTYLAAAQSLREFERTMSDESKKAFQSYVAEGKLDETFSQQLAARGELEKWDEERQQIPEMTDPHTLSTQRAASFKQDNEESNATDEDFELFRKSKNK